MSGADVETPSEVPRLLLDENLAPGLVKRLWNTYPASSHVREVGLASADDDAVWRFAAEQGYVIVTKDDDFRQRSFLAGAPPKVIWVKFGNCRSDEIEAVLRDRYADVCAFAGDRTASLLVLSRQRER